MMKVIIAGSRTFNDYEFLKMYCDSILINTPTVEVVSGCAKGADKFGEMYAEENYYLIHRFPAEWGKYGRSAGYRRNVQMAEFADALIAFWKGTSPGTKHMIDIAKQKNLKVRVINC